MLESFFGCWEVGFTGIGGIVAGTTDEPLVNLPNNPVLAFLSAEACEPFADVDELDDGAKVAGMVDTEGSDGVLTDALIWVEAVVEPVGD